MRRTRVKICGLTRPVDAAAAAEAGADAIGVVFAESPRRVTIRQALGVLDAAGGAVLRVGVFADQPLEVVLTAAERCRLDWVQLSGREPADLARAIPLRVLKAVHVGDRVDLTDAAAYPADAFLLDAPAQGTRLGGTGRAFDWEAAVSIPWPRHRFAVAGGLDPSNVGRAIARFAPGGVDVSSGVESAAGIKDRHRIESFIAAVRVADTTIRDATAGKGVESDAGD